MKKLLLLAFTPLLLTSCTFDSNSAAVGMGEWAYAGDYGVKVVKVDNVKTIKSISDYKTQNNYMAILVELKNNSSLSHSFSYYDFTLHKGSNKYESKATEAWWYADSKGDYESVYLSGSISASLSGKYYLVFETPTAHTVDNYQLKYSYGFNTATINLYKESN